jgi:membrane-associated protein
MPAAIDLTPDLGGLTATLVYLVVFGFVFVESGLLIGFLLPGDSLLFAAGLVSAAEGSGVSLTVLVIGVLVAARWIPWVRTFVPILAGAARMPYRRFLPANIVGAVIWGVGLLVIGHLAATEPTLRHTSYVVAGAFVATSLVLAVIGMARRRR